MSDDDDFVVTAKSTEAVVLPKKKRKYSEKRSKVTTKETIVISGDISDDIEETKTPAPVVSTSSSLKLPSTPKVSRKKTGLQPKKVRKEAKVQRVLDKRSLGRSNDYVITTVAESLREEIWKKALSGRKVIDRRNEKMPMSDCWTYGNRKGYSYFPIKHGESQLKLTQLAIWMTEKKVVMKRFVLRISDCLLFNL
jgi:hypothetical protein